MICLKFLLKAFKLLFQLVLLTLWCRDIQAQFLSQSHYKSEVVNNIGKKIAAARGDMRLMPVIEINSNSNKQPLIAQFQSTPQPKIILDEKLYDLCIEFGADSLNAMACVIGHEMAHFYENHVWNESFSNMMGLSKNRSTAISKEEKGMLEAKADAFGLFYGFLAGFDTYMTLPKILQAIYKEYKIPDRQEGYPDKSERLRFSEEKIDEISPLLFVFRAGQFLFLRKEFEAAASCFDYILRQYPGPEIYNNAGLTRLARVMELMEPKEIYFAYPFELDANTRLKRGTLRGEVNPIERMDLKVSLLLDAQAAFEKALSMDKIYPPAYINLACTYSLQDNQAAAIGKINEMEALNRSSGLPANGHLIRGIALVKYGQVEKAKPDFDKAELKKAFQYTYNKELYLQISGSWKDKTIHWLTHWPTAENWIRSYWTESNKSNFFFPDRKWKTISSIKLGQTMENPEVSVVIPGQEYPLKVVGKTNAAGYYLQLDLPDYRLDAFYSRSSLAFSEVIEAEIGSSISASQFLPVNPTYSISGTGGIRYDYYPNERIVLELENEKIRGWWKYEISY